MTKASGVRMSERKKCHQGDIAEQFTHEGTEGETDESVPAWIADVLSRWVPPPDYDERLAAVVDGYAAEQSGTRTASTAPAPAPPRPASLRPASP